MPLYLCRAYACTIMALRRMLYINKYLVWQSPKLRRSDDRSVSESAMLTEAITFVSGQKYIIIEVWIEKGRFRYALASCADMARLAVWNERGPWEIDKSYEMKPKVNIIVRYRNNASALVSKSKAFVWNTTTANLSSCHCASAYRLS